uniref:Uncharacterized protein n=1 Tax=Paramoeba aestuarina TaxID=180227 RepID=A0A7S4NQA6_9EUKA|mmetsp:Transcript_2390/g.3726  ORF Transcript_2390/g.3726 Transcript_2390/m.3726 type:complete len:109 (+) Transcript_2390:11-337(+)
MDLVIMNRELSSSPCEIFVIPQIQSSKPKPLPTKKWNLLANQKENIDPKHEPLLWMAANETDHIPLVLTGKKSSPSFSSSRRSTVAPLKTPILKKGRRARQKRLARLF